MKNQKLFFFSFFVVAFMLGSSLVFAGSGKIKFGAYTGGGQGCSGTGVCQTGSTGAPAIFDFYQNTDTAGGTFTRLTITVNYDQAVSFGFEGSGSGGNYVFTGGYPFNHPSDEGLGVPSTYSIPTDYACSYKAKDGAGRIQLIISDFTRNTK